MNNRITFYQVVERFNENNLQYEVIYLQSNFRIILSQRGGRILGPFLGEEGESILWLNQSFNNRERFKAFLDSGDWNMGGDRIWIAPELQYNVKDQDDFFGSYALQAQIDPGNYSLSKLHEIGCTLKQHMKLQVYNTIDYKELSLDRRIMKVKDPLSCLSEYEELTDEVLFTGFEHTTLLSEKYPNEINSEVWNLTQINPGGEIFIPSALGTEYVDYYEPIDHEFQSIQNNYIKLKITGNRRYKVGYKSVNILGRIGYLNCMEDDIACLLIRVFNNNPSAPYTKEPALRPGHNGSSVHIYNDNGDVGGFAELECSGQPIGGSTYKSNSNDQFITWIYQGPENKIKRISEYILGRI